MRVVVVELDLKRDRDIEDAHSLAAAIATHMARIYEIPDTHLMVNVRQSACMQFGGWNQPAYLRKVFARPSFVAPMTNLRCTISLQSTLHQLLQIAPNRGVILYFSVHDDNFATNSVTISVARLLRRLIRSVNFSGSSRSVRNQFRRRHARRAHASEISNSTSK